MRQIIHVQYSFFYTEEHSSVYTSHGNYLFIYSSMEASNWLFHLGQSDHHGDAVLTCTHNQCFVQNCLKYQNIFQLNFQCLQLKKVSVYCMGKFRNHVICQLLAEI